MKIKLVDVARQTENHKKEITDSINRIIDNSNFILGKEVQIFEKSFARFCNRKYAIGLNSGTDALKLGLLAYGVKAGDEIITVPNSYFSSAMVISEIGAIPIFVDVNPKTFTIDTNQLEKVVTSRTKGIIPVHLYGQCADMDEIAIFAKKNNLFILEDACQAHGAEYKGIKAPIVETAAFSFYPSKNLGCFGDGGILVTDNKEIAKKVQYLRNDGSIQKYKHKYMGIKSRLDTIQAAVLNAKLPYLLGWNDARRKHATEYTKFLKNNKEIILPEEAKHRKHVYHLYVIKTKKRDLLKDFLKKNGVETGVHYPIPIHLQETYSAIGYSPGMFPITEEASKSILSLPMFPELTRNEIIYICNIINRFFINN